MHLHDVFEVHVKHVADGSASPRFGDRPRHNLIGARAGVDRLDPGKAFFEHRQNFHCSIRRQSAIDVQRAAFLQGLLVSVVDALGMTGEREGKNRRAQNYETTNTSHRGFAV